MSLKLTLLAAGAVLAIGSTGAMAQGLSENQARSLFLNKCPTVSTLSRDSKGNWHGTCSAIGGTPYMVDTTGALVPDVAPVGALTEGQARSVFLSKCPTVSTLSEDTAGNWHGTCSAVGGTAYMVDKTGNLVADTGDVTNGITEAHARMIALNTCTSVSGLHRDPSGNWRGTCNKNVASSDIIIDKTGKVMN